MEDQFSKYDTFSISVASYNTAGCKKPGDLNAWLFPADQEVPDVYVVGLQDLCGLSTSEMFFSDKVTPKLWNTAVEECMQCVPKVKYQLLKSETSGGQSILLFAKKAVQTKVGDIAACTCLGAACLRFKF